MAGTLAAKTAGLGHQPVTSHPVIQNELTTCEWPPSVSEWSETVLNHLCLTAYDYREVAVVVSNEVPGKGTLVTR
jgi:protein DJ-1